MVIYPKITNDVTTIHYWYTFFDYFVYSSKYLFMIFLSRRFLPQFQHIRDSLPRGVRGRFGQYS